MIDIPDDLDGRSLIGEHGLLKPGGEQEVGIDLSFFQGRVGLGGLPEDISSVVAWLLSPQSGWVTGQVIDAEGGFRR